MLCSQTSSPLQQPALSTLLSAPVGLWVMFTKRPRRALEQLSADAISARPSSVPPLPIPEHAGGARKASRRGEVVLLGGR